MIVLETRFAGRQTRTEGGEKVNREAEAAVCVDACSWIKTDAKSLSQRSDHMTQMGSSSLYQDSFNPVPPGTPVPCTVLFDALRSQ